MKLLKTLILGGIALAIPSCISSHPKNLTLSEASPKKIRFQNSLGLKLYYAGCSTRNYGGVERMCQHSEQNPADLVFQIGPAFSTVLYEDTSPNEIKSKRNALWKVFELEKVKFYSVDALDLEPSLQAFTDSHRGSEVRLLSSNVKTEGNNLFEPYLIYEVLGKKIGFVSLTRATYQKTDPSFKVQPQDEAFNAVSEIINSQVDIFYVLGNVGPAMRKKISFLSKKPILFLGGDLMENNSTQLLVEGGRDFFAKAPDFGEGFGDIIVSLDVKDFKPSTSKSIGGLFHSFKAVILKEVPLKFNACSQALQSAQPQALPTEAAGH
jgi:hypothetical protein